MKPRTKVVIRVAIAVAIVLFLISMPDTSYQVLNQVQKGNKVLLCIFEDGERVVPKEKVVSFDVDLLTWEFTNGSSKNCRTVDRGY